MDWMKYRWLYLLISGTVILSGIFSILKWGFPLGIDFKGGVVLEYKLPSGLTRVIKAENLNNAQREKIKSDLEKEVGGKVTEIRYENIGPTVGGELVKKTIYGLLTAASGILLWVAIQFRSFKFGISATLATLHDTLVTIGIYSIFGRFFGAEVDLLFVTALLTVLSFSVHDTIIVYDRIRESKKAFGSDFYDLANKAITETMVRSLNNTFVVIFMMVALLLFGGATIRFFVATLLVGTLSGAYSSPFVAVPILVTWDELAKKLKK